MPESILPVDRARLAKLREDWEKSLEDYTSFPCDGDSEESWVTYRNHAHTVLKEVEEERKTLTEPINRDLKQINEWYRTARAPLEAFKELANSKLNALALQRSQAAIEARKLAAQAAAAGDHAAAVAAIVAAPPEPVAVAGNSVRYEWRPVVVQPMLVPRDFLMVDEAKLKAYSKTVEQPTPVSGVRFDRVAINRPTGR
jgi:hypothetical protein